MSDKDSLSDGELDSFEIKHDWFIDMGESKKGTRYWVPEVVEVGGKQFATLSKCDRSFAAFVSAPLSSSAPFKRDTFIDYLQELRHAVVEKKMLQATLKDADPMADASANRKQKKQKLGSIDDIEKVIEINIPELNEGAVPEFQMLVVATARKQDCVQVELNSENLRYIKAAMFNGPTADEVAMSYAIEVSFDNPAIKWNPRTLIVFARYRDADGVWKQKTKSCPRLENRTLWTMVIDAAGKEIDEFYQAHHHPPEKSDSSARRAGGQQS